jgi:membrane protein implicated in regulation of membrane protease activity
MFGADVLDLGIDIDVWPWVWLVVAVVFAVIEISFVGGTFVLLPFAVSAFAASLLGFSDAPIEAQWAVFVFGGAALFVVAYRWVRRFIQRNDLPVGVGADRLIGLVGFATADIMPSDVERRGRVTVEGEVWAALAAGTEPIAAGTSIRVVEVVGTRVVVEPMSSPAPPDVDSGGAGTTERSPE